MSIKVTGSGFRHVHHNLQNAIKGGYRGSRFGMAGAITHLETKANEYLEKNSNYPKSAVRKKSFSEAISWNWIHLDPWIDGNYVRGILGNSSPHAPMVEFGVPGLIRPVSGPFLHFKDPDTGKWITTRGVKGQQPMHYLQNTINLEGDAIVDIFGKNILCDIYSSIG